MIMDILPILMNAEKKRIMAIDDYRSFIWTTRYYECGDFELVLPVRSEYLNNIKQDYYIVRDDDDQAGIIEDITLRRTEDGFDELIVTGRFLTSLIGRRIITPQRTVSGDVLDNMRYLIRTNCVSNYMTDPARTIPHFQVEGTTIYGETFDGQYTGNNLLDTISDLAETYGVGFTCEFNETADHTDLYYKFYFYQGTDRSYDQNVNPYVVFSDEYENLTESEYEESYMYMVNAVLVAGEGEGLTRTTAWATEGTPEGLDRYELYLDKRNIRSNDGEISQADYLKMLEEAGKAELTSFSVAFQGIAFFTNVKYKEDVFVGDLVQVESKKWGLSMKARLIEVIESVDETGMYTIMPTFGR